MPHILLYYGCLCLRFGASDFLQKIGASLIFTKTYFLLPSWQITGLLLLEYSRSCLKKRDFFKKSPIEKRGEETVILKAIAFLSTSQLSPVLENGFFSGVYTTLCIFMKIFFSKITPKSFSNETLKTLYFWIRMAKQVIQNQNCFVEFSLKYCLD